MKNTDNIKDDDLRSEYDLKSLRVRRTGAKRDNFPRNTVQLEPDVAAIFPGSRAVNSALRLLIKEKNIGPHLNRHNST